MKYYVRKSWEDEVSQIGEYDDLEEAQKNLEPEYTIYDSNGKGIIGCAYLTQPKIARTNYQVVMKELKRFYQEKIDVINNDKDSDVFDYINKLYYQEFLNTIEKIEEEIHKF